MIVSGGTVGPVEGIIIAHMFFNILKSTDAQTDKI